jgi:hypothetical protein
MEVLRQVMTSAKPGDEIVSRFSQHTLGKEFSTNDYGLEDVPRSRIELDDDKSEDRQMLRSISDPAALSTSKRSAALLGRHSQSWKPAAERRPACAQKLQPLSHSIKDLRELRDPSRLHRPRNADILIHANRGVSWWASDAPDGANTASLHATQHNLQPGDLRRGIEPLAASKAVLMSVNRAGGAFREPERVYSMQRPFSTMPAARHHHLEALVHEPRADKRRNSCNKSCNDGCGTARGPHPMPTPSPANPHHPPPFGWADALLGGADAISGTCPLGCQLPRMSITELYNALAEGLGGRIIVDVRTPDEYDEAHVWGAVDAEESTTFQGKHVLIMTRG